MHQLHTGLQHMPLKKECGHLDEIFGCTTSCLLRISGVGSNEYVVKIMIFPFQWSYKPTPFVINDNLGNLNYKTNEYLWILKKTIAPTSSYLDPFWPSNSIERSSANKAGILNAKQNLISELRSHFTDHLWIMHYVLSLCHACTELIGINQDQPECIFFIIQSTFVWEFWKV